MNTRRDEARREEEGRSETRPDKERRSVFPGFADLAADPAELIGRLTAMRQAHDLSQTEVAARMGTSQSAVARLESGKADVRLSTLTRYAEAVEASLGFALQRAQEEST